MIDTGKFLGALAPKDHSLATRARIDQLSAELATERHTDLGTALRSDFSRVSVAAHDLRTFQARSANLTHATLWGETIQNGLDGIKSDLGDLFSAVATSLTGAADPSLTGLGEVGSAALSNMLSRLEVRVGGRGVFSNGLSETSPWPGLETIQGDLAALAAGETDVAGLTSAINEYFSATGPFGAAIATLPADAVTFPFGGGDSAQFPVSAASSEIVAALRQAALATALPSAGFALTEVDRETVKASLSANLLASQGGVSRLEGRIGAVEARIADLADAAETDRAKQESALADAIAPDPFEVAIRLQSEMSRLESTYAITARRSRLNLTDFIR